MRYPKYVSLNIHHLSQLLVAWNKFYVDPDNLGEAILGESYPGVVKEINRQSTIQLTPKQVYNLVWYYKHAVLERLSHNHKKLPKNYHQMMEALEKQVPILFTKDKDGEIRVKENREILGDYEGDL